MPYRFSFLRKSLQRARPALSFGSVLTLEQAQTNEGSPSYDFHSQTPRNERRIFGAGQGGSPKLYL
jgi:hypothetical protein